MEKRSGGEEVAGGGSVEQLSHVTMNSSSCFTTAAAPAAAGTLGTKPGPSTGRIVFQCTVGRVVESTKQGVSLWTMDMGDW